MFLIKKKLEDVINMNLIEKRNTENICAICKRPLTNDYNEVKYKKSLMIKICKSHKIDIKGVK